jgi:hypothetical protein
MEGILKSEMSISDMLEAINKMNKCNFSNNPSKEQEFFKRHLTKEKAEILLSSLSGDSIVSSKKPLWIDETKRTCNRLIPALDYKEVNSTFIQLEETKDMLMDDGDTECYLDLEDYPYYHTIKKLLYAFGDTLKNNHKTIILFHEFVKKWLIEIGKLANECEFKKVLEHLYSYEVGKYNTYKKLKIKNNFNNEDEMIVEDDDVLIDLDEKKDFIENIFEDKDSEYYENLTYQDERTKGMTDQEYIDYNVCRTQSFMNKGKKAFLNYLQTLMPNLCLELKDQCNLDLISFLLKELMHKIVKQAIKNKNPEGKLFILKHPLLPHDVEALVDLGIETIESFLSDYYNSIYLIKEFRKKRGNGKENNKNVKIRKEGDCVTIVIKKFVFLDDSETFKKFKKAAENKLLTLVRRLTSGGRKREKQITAEIDEISNYYEYFLMKDYFKVINKTEVQYNPTNLKKINKKYIITKLKQWLSLTSYDRELDINEYNNI